LDGGWTAVRYNILLSFTAVNENNVTLSWDIYYNLSGGGSGDQAYGIIRYGAWSLGASIGDTFQVAIILG
jgi:hypothetical protein